MTTTAAAAARRHPLAGILTLYLLTPTVGLVLPDIANISVAFQISAATATWVATLSSLAMIPVTIATGLVAGTRIGFRPLVIGATVISVVAGVLPALTGRHLGLLLLWRVLWGVGAGALLTASNSLVVLSFTDQRTRARMLGLGNLVFCAGSMLSLIVGGYLATISWQAPFYGHLIGVPALVVLALFLHEPRPASPPAAHPSGPRRMSSAAYLPMICFMVAVMAIYPVSTLMSVVFQQATIGAPSLVGVVGSLMTVTGLLVAPVFGLVYAKMAGRVMPASVLVCCAGLVVLYLASGTGSGSVIGYATGVVITGCGLVGLTIGTPMVTSTLVPAEAASQAQGMVAASLNLGGVLSSGYAAVTVSALGGPGGLVRPLYLVSVAVLLLSLLPLTILHRRPAVDRGSPPALPPALEVHGAVER